MTQIHIESLRRITPSGFLAQNKNGNWWWYLFEPTLYQIKGHWATVSSPKGPTCYNISKLFDIIGFDGSWEDSLMKCGKDF